jgi:hypothetical protein
MPLLIVAAVLVALALPASVNAQSGYEVHRGDIKLILPVERKAGRVISVSASGRQGVQFTVEGSSSAIEYSTKGRASSRRIEADFGALGRINVRLRLARSGPGVFRRPHCNGHDPVEGEGTYRGMIKFPGEDGVPKVSVTHGRFYFERRFRRVCKRHREKVKPNPFPRLMRKIEEGILVVRGKGEGRSVRLEARIFAFRRNPTRSGGGFRVEVYERHEAVRITRSTGGPFGRNAFVMSRRGKEPETVEVELSKPFVGRALYSGSHGSPSSWTGDLSVDLPGVDDVLLTGAGFSAVLCRGNADSCL